MQKIKLFLFLVLALFVVEVVSLSDNSLLTSGSSSNVLVNISYIDKLRVPLVYSKSDQINLSQFNFSVNKNYMSLYNRTLIYVTLVNRSSYIVFYPSLYKSYLDLSDSLKVKNSDPALSYTLLKEAYINANVQLKDINEYRIVTFVAIIVLTVLTAIYLINIMKGPKSKSKANLKDKEYDTVKVEKAVKKARPKAKPKAKKRIAKAKKSKTKKGKKANK